MENKPKRKRKKKRGKFIARRIALICFCIFFLIISFFFISNLLRVKEIKIKGTERMPKDSIEKILLPIKGENYLFMKKKELKDNIEKIPYVKKVELSYQFPNGLLVEINEEKPVAQIFSKRDYVLLNRDLKVLEKTRTFDTSLPKVTGIQTNDLKLGDSLLSTVKNKGKIEFFHNVFSSEIINEVTSIEIMEQGIHLYTKEDIKIIIRSFQDSSYKLMQLEKIYKEITNTDEEFATILLDQSEHPIAIRKSDMKETEKPYKEKKKENSKTNKSLGENKNQNLEKKDTSEE